MFQLVQFQQTTIFLIFQKPDSPISTKKTKGSISKSFTIKKIEENGSFVTKHTKLTISSDPNPIFLKPVKKTKQETLKTFPIKTNEKLKFRNETFEIYRFQLPKHKKSNPIKRKKRKC